MREAESRWPSVAGSEAAERGRTSSEGAEHADLPTRAARPARSPPACSAEARAVPTPRHVDARRPDACTDSRSEKSAGLLLQSAAAPRNRAGRAGRAPPRASQTLNRSNSGVGAADGDTYDGGGRSCTNINKKTHRVQISHFSKQGRQGRQGTPLGLGPPKPQ